MPAPRVLPGEVRAEIRTQAPAFVHPGTPVLCADRVGLVDDQQRPRYLVQRSRTPSAIARLRLSTIPMFGEGRGFEQASRYVAMGQGRLQTRQIA